MFVFREEYYGLMRETTKTTRSLQERMERLHGKAEVIIGKQRHTPRANLSFEAAPPVGNGALHHRKWATKPRDLQTCRRHSLRQFHVKNSYEHAIQLSI
jgi:hypothetical protein